jgi:hypothetical protein
MGLDIYLYHYTADPKEVHRLEHEYAERTDALWNDGVDEKHRKKEQKRIAKELGLDEDGEHPGKQRVDLKSKIAPDNVNRVGYFRSSYNGGGINNVIRRVLGEDKSYYYIFGQRGVGDFAPDWKVSRERALEVLNLLGEANNRARGHYVMELSANPFSDFTKPQEVDGRVLDNERAVLDFFLTELDTYEKRNGDGLAFGSSYTKMGGEFVMEGVKVKAIIWGGMPTFVRPRPGEVVPPGPPKVYLVCEATREDNDAEAVRKHLATDGNSIHQSYFDSLNIVVETCDYVLAKPDPERYVLHWSG